MLETSPHDASTLYLDLLKKTLTRWGQDEIARVRPDNFLKRGLATIIESKNLEIVRRSPFDARARESGLDHPKDAETMIGLKRLDNLEECIRTVVAEDVPGDLIETGVWRGGGSIFMRAVLRSLNAGHRVVWCADSFEGLPAPDLEKYPQDRHAAKWHEMAHLRVSLEQVRENFKKYDLLDDHVRFLKGWFKNTLPTAPIERLSILRLDGDLYESTMDALEALYHKLSPGGFAIIDDYGMVEPTCRSAVHDFRDRNGISSPIVDIDGNGAFWRKDAGTG